MNCTPFKWARWSMRPRRCGFRWRKHRPANEYYIERKRTRARARSTWDYMLLWRKVSRSRYFRFILNQFSSSFEYKLCFRFTITSLKRVYQYVNHIIQSQHINHALAYSINFLFFL
jgi:hypothetical protein